MTTTLNYARRALRGGTALQALALLGAGVGAAGIATPAAAQDFTQVNATGRVQSTGGQPIAGATVTVTSNDQGFTRTATTSSDGSYRVPSLPQGNYTFTIEASGYDTFSDNSVRLTQAGAANQFTLAAAGEAGGDVIVTAGRTQIADFDRNTVGAVIQIGELATRVPVARDLTSVILLAPGTATGDSAFGNLPAVAGSSVSENAYYVNGLNITDFRQGLGAGTIPFEFYNTVETKIGSIPAEYGRFTGAFVNATTKSGGNEFHGGFLFNWQPDSLRDDSPNTLYDYNQQDTRDLKQTIFYLSGPIIKDHLFFYGMYQSNDQQSGDTFLSVVNTGTTTTNGVRTGLPAYSLGNSRTYYRNRSPFFGGKLDAVIVDGQRLEFTYINTRAREVRRTFNVLDQSGGTYDSRVDTGISIGGFRGTSINRVGSENYIGRYTGQFTDWLTLSAAYGKAMVRNISGSNDDSLPAIADSTGGRFTPPLTGNVNGSIATNNDTRTFYRGDADVYFNLLGQHHIRGGYDREELQSLQQNVRTGGFNYTYYAGSAGDAYGVTNPNQLYFSRTTYRNGGTFNSLNEAAYVQDSWSGFDNRINVQAGVRWDRFKNNNVANVRYYDSGDQFAPRISLSFDPIGDQRTKIYGFFGRYYLPVPTNTNIRLAGAELFQNEFFLTSGPGANNVPIIGAPVLNGNLTRCITTGVSNCEINDDGSPTDTTATVSKNLKPQSIDEYVLGYEQRIGQRWKIGAFGVYRKLNQSLEDVAIDAAVQKYCTAQRISGCNNIWTSFHQYVLVNPGEPARITLSDPINGESTLRTVDFSSADLGYPAAVRKYRAITLTLDREFDGVWSFNGSYTYAKNIGNIEGGVRSDNGQSDSGLSTAFDQPGLTLGTYGYLPTDVRHNIKGFGSYQIFPWLTIGTQVQVQSPRKYGCYGRVPNTVDRFAGQYGAAGYFCNVSNGQIVTDPAFTVINDNPVSVRNPRQTTLLPNRRGTVFQSDWQSYMNLSLVAKLPQELFSATVRFDVFNVFNEQARIDFNEFGTAGNGQPRADYRAVNTYQTPRYVRIQLGLDF